jgi:NTE family protein
VLCVSRCEAVVVCFAAIMAKRALVLGGGGPVGVAWESGLIAGLAEAGVDLSVADFIMGTSAGSFVGAFLAAGRSPAEVVAPFLGDAMPSSPSEMLTSPPDLLPLIGKMMDSYAGVRPNAEVLAEIGSWALQASVLTEEAYLSSFGRSLASFPEGYWPERRYACTAVDAESGAFVQWDRNSKVALTRAVASSCAVPGVFPPVTINGRRYMDGGMRSATNADLAKGCEVVVIVSVASQASPEVFRRPLDRELKALQESGSKVEVLRPNAESLEAFGPNLMDYRRRPAAAASGLKQGQAGLDALRAVWGS